MRIRELRKERGWTQQQLADASGVSRLTIGDVELGKQHPTTRTLERVASALGVSVADLVDEPELALPKGSAPSKGQPDPWAEAYAELGRRLLKKWRAEVKERAEELVSAPHSNHPSAIRARQWMRSILTESSFLFQGLVAGHTGSSSNETEAIFRGLSDDVLQDVKSLWSEIDQHIPQLPARVQYELEELEEQLKSRSAVGR